MPEMMCFLEATQVELSNDPAGPVQALVMCGFIIVFHRFLQLSSNAVANQVSMACFHEPAQKYAHLHRLWHKYDDYHSTLAIFSRVPARNYLKTEEAKKLGGVRGAWH